jgi:hypothetical protein
MEHYEAHQRQHHHCGACATWDETDYSAVLRSFRERKQSDGTDQRKR